MRNKWKGFPTRRTQVTKEEGCAFPAASGCPSHSEPLTVTVKVNGIELNSMVETGEAQSLMNPVAVLVNYQAQVRDMIETLLRNNVIQP